MAKHCWRATIAVTVFIAVLVLLGKMFDAWSRESNPKPVVSLQRDPASDKKFSLTQESDFGCKELQCIANCQGEGSRDCLQSPSCISGHRKICLKRCRKTRCEERCKNEPSLSDIERDQRLEQCKNGCDRSSPTASKCMVICYIQSKPCKSRCYETAARFQCNNSTILKALGPASSDNKLILPPGEDTVVDKNPSNKAVEISLRGKELIYQYIGSASDLQSDKGLLVP
jgi:hypothetical protein